MAGIRYGHKEFHDVCSDVDYPIDVSLALPYWALIRR
jgi:hypothetical protein